MNRPSVAIVGTRNPSRRTLDVISAGMERMNPDTIIVAGEQRGVDAHVRKEAHRLGLSLVVAYARWDAKGPHAGPERNAILAQIADRVIAFPKSADRKASPGTWSCVDEFKALGKPSDVRDTEWRVEA